MSSMIKVVRSKDIAALLSCPICNKIVRNATTITECLHTFCKKCIYRCFKEVGLDICPVCEIYLGGNPMEKLRPDHNLRSLRSKIFASQKIDAKQAAVLATKAEEADPFEFEAEEPEFTEEAEREPEIATKPATKVVTEVVEEPENVKAVAKEAVKEAAKDPEFVKEVATEPEVPSIPFPVRRKEKSLSSLVHNVPNKNVMTAGQTQTARKASVFLPIVVPYLNDDDYPESSSSPMTVLSIPESSNAQIHNKDSGQIGKLLHGITNLSKPLNSVVKASGERKTDKTTTGTFVFKSPEIIILDDEDEANVSKVKGEKCVNKGKGLIHNAGEKSANYGGDIFHDQQGEKSVNKRRGRRQFHDTINKKDDRKVKGRVHDVEGEVGKGTASVLPKSAAEGFVFKSPPIILEKDESKTTSDKCVDKGKGLLHDVNEGRGRRRRRGEFYDAEYKKDDNKAKSRVHDVEGEVSKGMASVLPKTDKTTTGGSVFNSPPMITSEDQANVSKTKGDKCVDKGKGLLHDAKGQKSKNKGRGVFNDANGEKFVNKRRGRGQFCDANSRKDGSKVRGRVHDAAGEVGQGTASVLPPVKPEGPRSRLKIAGASDVFSVSAQALVDAASGDCSRRLHSVWLLLVASDSQRFDPPLQPLPSPYLRMKDINAPLWFIQKYIMHKLKLKSIHEVEIAMRGHPLPPNLLLKDLTKMWSSTIGESKIHTKVGGKTDEFIMVLTYGRRAAA